MLVLYCPVGAGGFVMGLQHPELPLWLVLKEEGMERARQAPDVQTWKAQFIEAVREQVATDPNAGFTSEDIIAVVGLPRTETGMNANNAVGAMMNGLAKRGLIYKTAERRRSRRPSSHGAELAVWKGTEGTSDA